MVKRIPVPKSIQGTVLFKAEHTCSICHSPGHVQIAHIDGNRGNNAEDNLIVLCPNDHAKVDARSPIGKAYLPEEIRQYKQDWEKSVASKRGAFTNPPLSRLIRFDGNDVNTVYLETETNVLRGFQDRTSFELLGYNWGNIDIYPDTDREKFNIQPPLQKLSASRKIRFQFSNGTEANEVYVVWEDGKKHHVPDPETLNEIGGYEGVENLGYADFNSIPHGQSLVDIYTIRTRRLLQKAMKKAKPSQVS